MSSYTTIGSCSLCNGRVTIPSLWGSVVPPVATCENCGAEAASHGPIISMVKPKPPNGHHIWDFTSKEKSVFHVSKGGV